MTYRPEPFNPTEIASQIIEILAKHKVTLDGVDIVFEEVHNQLKKMTIQPSDDKEKTLARAVVKHDIPKEVCIDNGQEFLQADFGARKRRKTPEHAGKPKSRLRERLERERDEFYSKIKPFAHIEKFINESLQNQNIICPYCDEPLSLAWCNNRIELH